MEVLALGAAYLAGVGPGRLMVLALTLLAPIALLPLVVLAVFHSRRELDDRAALFCDGVASELRAGMALRSALHTAARSVGLTPGPDPVEGQLSVDDMAGEIAKGLPAISPELEAVVRVAARSGGATADLFDELAALTIAQNEIARELRVASAPARATAWFFVLAPAAFMAFRFADGGFDGLLAVPGQRITAVAGMLLFLAGLAAVWYLMRRSS